MRRRLRLEAQFAGRAIEHPNGDHERKSEEGRAAEECVLVADAQRFELSTAPGNVVLGLRGGDGGQDGDAESATDLLAGVHQSRGKPSVSCVDARECCDLDRDHRCAQSETDQDRRAEQIREVRAVAGDSRE